MTILHVVTGDQILYIKMHILCKISFFEESKLHTTLCKFKTGAAD